MILSPLRDAKPERLVELDRDIVAQFGFQGVWLFNEGGGGTVRDYAGGYDGTLVNAPAWNNAPSFNNGLLANPGTRLDFTSASDQYVSIGQPQALVPVADYTIALHYRLFTAPSNTTFQLVSKDKDTGGRSFSLDSNNVSASAASSGLRFYINGGGVAGDLAVEGVFPVANVDRHVVATYQLSTKQLAVYVNGVLIAANTSATVGIPASTANILFARREYAGFTEPLNGVLSYVYIGNRYLLADDVKALYQDPYQIVLPTAIERYYSYASAALLTAQAAMGGIGALNASAAVAASLSTSAGGTGGSTSGGAVGSASAVNMAAAASAAASAAEAHSGTATLSAIAALVATGSGQSSCALSGLGALAAQAATAAAASTSIAGSGALTVSANSTNGGSPFTVSMSALGALVATARTDSGAALTVFGTGVMTVATAAMVVSYIRVPTKLLLATSGKTSAVLATSGKTSAALA